MRLLMTIGLALVAWPVWAQAQEPATTLSRVTIVVRDVDEALRYYTEILGFEKRADLKSSGMRWVTVAPKGQSGVQIILLKADKENESQVGKGTTWVLDTGDCRKTYAFLKDRGVKFIQAPEQTPWGVQALFVDLYGNPFALMEPGADRP